MKFNEFIIDNYFENVRSDSKFFNKENMKAINKTVTFFDNYFINASMLSRLKANSMIFDFNVPRDLINRIEVLANYLYDEQPTYGYGYQGNGYKLDRRDDDLIILKVILATKILLAYTSHNIRKQTVENIDNYFSSLFYKIVYSFNAFDQIDNIIYYRGRKKLNKNLDNNENNIPNAPITVNDWKNKDVEPDYDYDRNKETALITALIRININFISRNKDLSLEIAQKYSAYLQIVEDMNPFVTDFNFVNKLSLFKLIKDIKTETMSKDLDDDDKQNIIDKINELLESNTFDNVIKYNEINTVLTYGGDRPDFQCKKLMDKYIADYKYTGVVYHGFYNINGVPDVLSVLRHYENGFISCSKNLRTAKNFAHQGSDCNMFGGVLEIYVDDDMEAIDVEKILTDAYNKEKSVYRNLYNSFINEREVLIKMPIKKYRLLTPRDIDIILGDDQYLQEYKPTKKVQPMNNTNK